jgi:hypothetical protein
MVTIVINETILFIVGSSALADVYENMLDFVYYQREK